MKKLILVMITALALCVPAMASKKPTPYVLCGSSDCLGAPQCDSQNIGVIWVDGQHGYRCTYAATGDYWQQIY